MPKPQPADGAQRKADHLRIAAGGGIEHAAGTGLDAVRLRHRALPERALESVRLDTTVLGRCLRAPLLISAITGGTDEAAVINDRLIRAAGEHGIGLVLGSGRRLLGDESLRATYRPPGAPQPPLLLANLGAAQIRGRHGPERAERLVDMLDAHGLSVHLNPLQEAIQPEGEPDFSGVLSGIAAVAARLAPRPVVVKEVGFGLDAEDILALRDAGVAAVDVAGAGGTNWALIEGQRDLAAASVATAFAGWGVPTIEALVAARRVAPELPAIASGGLRDGVEIAKCLALGAAACGLARPLLIAAQADQVDAAIGTLLSQLRIATWAAGASAADALGEEHLQ
jgi:isopentenyl-diphosphate delta-isomerase